MKKATNTILLAIYAFVFLATTSPLLAVTPEKMPRDNSVKTNVVKKTSATEKVSSCRAKESSVKIRMAQLTKLATTMEATFDKSSSKVQTYYTNTVLTSGKSISNYSALVNDIEAKKVAIKTELDKAKSNASAFNCETDSPKASLDQFRANMQSVKTALKNHRTSVKNLIVAVRSSSKEIKVTPTPSI